MNRTLIILTLSLLLLTTLAGAQTKDPAPTTQPAYNSDQASRFNCQTLAGKHWLAITDPSITPEDAAYHERAANAYEHLSNLSWPC